MMEWHSVRTTTCAERHKRDATFGCEAHGSRRAAGGKAYRHSRGGTTSGRAAKPGRRTILLQDLALLLGVHEVGRAEALPGGESHRARGGEG